MAKQIVKTLYINDVPLDVHFYYTPEQPGIYFAPPEHCQEHLDAEIEITEVWFDGKHEVMELLADLVLDSLQAQLENMESDDE